MLAAVLFGLFLVVLLLGVPIGFSMGFLTIAAFEVGNGPLITLAQKMYAGINNFTYLAIPLFIFAAVLMMNFIIVSISYRKKDIGILRAIGARSTDVLKIFIWEGVMLAAISYVITMIGLQLVTLITNNFAKDEIGVLISPVIITLRQPLLMLVIVAVVTFIACILPVTRIARQRPIDAIKK